MSTQLKEKDFGNLQGGWNPRLTPIVLGNQKGPMQSPDCRNVNFFYPGAVEKRLGKVKQGNNIVFLSPFLSQSNSNDTLNIVCGFGNVEVGQFVLAPSTQTIAFIDVFLSATWNGNINIPSFVLQIRNDNAGVPGTIITNGTSSPIIPNNTATPYLNRFVFPLFPSLTSGLNYWITLSFIYTSTTLTLHFSVQDGWSDVKYSIDNGNTYTDVFLSLKYTVYAGGYPMQGLYDFKYGPSVTQLIMGANGGILFWKNGSSWTSLKTGLGNGQNILFDFATYKNILISTDYSNNLPQAWDGLATSTMELGYRMAQGYTGIVGDAFTISSITGQIVVYTTATTSYVGQTQKLTGGASTQYLKVTAVSSDNKTITYDNSVAVLAGQTTMNCGGFTTADSATAGSFTVGQYRIMSVTKLKSGGYRASEEKIHNVATGSKQITVSNIKAAFSTDGSQYAWDVDVTATEWFMTTVGGLIYYKIPAASMLIGGVATTNAPPNATTTFNISGPVAGTENTLLQEYNLDSSYFTDQVNCPKFKFLTVYQNMICGGGDPNNLNYIWFSEQGTIHNWSNHGGYQGFGLGVARDDGQVLTGMHVKNGRLFALRTRTAFAINYTGNSYTPFTNDQIQSQFGCLSHWSIQDTDQGFKFLSQQGPAICYGSYILIDPASANILNYFEPNDPNHFNIGACKYSTSFKNETRKVIGWTMASTNSSTRDLILRHDYEKNVYWLDDGSQANYLTQVSNSDGTNSPWSGDYSGNVFQHDSGLDDNGIAINWYWSTPNFNPDGIGEEFKGRLLKVSGVTQTNGTLYIDEYLDLSATIHCTYSIDMSRTDFGSAIHVPLSGTNCHWLRFVFRNNDLDVPVKIMGLKLMWQPVRHQE